MRIPLLAIAMLAGSAASAQSAHEHGVANMLLASEGKELQIALESPAANILGFEYIPESKDEWEAVHQFHKLVSKPKKVFKFNKGASCKLEMLEIEPEALAMHDHKGHDHDEHHHDDHKGHDHDEHHHDDHKGHDHDEHHHDDHKGHDHDEHHHDDHKGHDHDEQHHDDHKGHDEHHHDDHKGHDHSEHNHEGHMDISVVWHFNCKGEVTSLEFVGIKKFLDMQEVNTTYLTDTAQGGAKLTASNMKLELK